MYLLKYPFCAAWSILGASALLVGCSAFPIYKPTPDQATTELKVSGGIWLSFKACARPKSESYSLDVDAENRTTRIPADGRPIMVNAYLMSTGYQVMHYCNAALNFYPRPGVTYVVNAGMIGEGRCFIELGKEDLSTKTGVVFESSVRPGAC